MKLILNITIGLLIIANMAFGVGLYNYITKSENKTWEQIRILK